MVEELRQKTGQRIGLDTGTSEEKCALPDLRALKRMLVDKGRRPGTDLRYHEIPGGQHTEYAWAERVAPMLKFLFPPRG